MGLMKFIKGIFGGDEAENKAENIVGDEALNEERRRESEALAMQKQALHYFEIGETDKALELLDSDILLSESSKTMKKAFEIEEAGEPHRALDFLDAAIEDDPENADGYYNAKAHIYTNLENHAEALKCHHKIIGLDEETEYFPEAEFLRVMRLVERGDCHTRLGDHQAALADFNRAIELAPDDARAISKRGDAYFALGEFEKALRDFNRCLEIEGEEPGWSSYLNRAKAYGALGDFERAADDCTEAIAVSRDGEFGTQGHLERGEIYFKKGDYQAALEDFSADIERYPKDPETYRKRAETYRRLQMFESAADDEEKAEFYENCQTGEDLSEPRTSI